MQNKEAFLVCAYTPDEERIEILNKTINFLKRDNRDIFLITHSHNTPSHIVSKCKYFLYSSNNILLDDPEHKYFVYHQIGDYEFGSKYLNNYKATTVAIYDMILNGFCLAKNCGYDIVHYVEYDADFENGCIFDFFSEKINEGYDSCVITGDTLGMHGGLFTVSLKSFTNEELKLDMEKLFNWSSELKITEHITEQLFLKEKKRYDHDFDSAISQGYNMTKYNQHRTGMKLDTVLFQEDRLFYFCNNITNNEYTQSILINGSYVVEINVPPHSYVFQDIFEKSNVKKVLFIKNNKVEESFDFETEEKIFVFQQNSYIKKIR